MDPLTLAVITIAAAALALRLVEIGRARPEVFAEIADLGARGFAEKALAESAALRARAAPVPAEDIAPAGRPLAA